MEKYPKDTTADWKLKQRLTPTGAAGLEPATRDLEGRYSIHLSYAPKSQTGTHKYLILF